MTHSFPTRGLSDLDVGDFADRAFEQRGVFEQRQLDLAIAVGRKHFTGDTVELLPGRAVDRQYIIESADGLEKIRHVLELRSEEHTSELQSLMRISYAVFCLKKKNLKSYESE